MKKEVLYNKKSRELLTEELRQEPFERLTCSFYRYIHIDNPELFRDELYRNWNAFDIFGRIYVATEGINAQFSCPEHHWEAFKKNMDSVNNEGKKLNFLLQEMGREINTIGSKTDLIEISHLVVDLKDELEKIREQVQNII